MDAYKAAFLKIEPKITDGQMKMLRGHYAAPERRLSVTKLADLASYKGAAPGKLHYGKLARAISEAMGEAPPTTDQISMIAEWDNTKDENGHGQWRLYEEVAMALWELGWD